MRWRVCGNNLRGKVAGGEREKRRQKEAQVGGHNSGWMTSGAGGQEWMSGCCRVEMPAKPVDLAPARSAIGGDPGVGGLFERTLGAASTWRATSMYIW